jgi:7-carboxy-7-deazaguanine synthase
MNPGIVARLLGLKRGYFLRIAEIYHSIQGEGLLTGTPSIFIRTSGCNLRCWFCDTPFTSWQPEGETVSIDEILQQVQKWDCRHIVLTGGEPLLWKETVPLCEELKRLGKHITIETAGTIFQPATCDLISISPKMANSTPTLERDAQWHKRHEETRFRPQVVGELMELALYQLKFVINDLADAEGVLEYLKLFPDIDRERVLLMPQGTLLSELEERAKWLIPWCRDHELRFCERAHIHWFGSQRGT